MKKELRPVHDNVACEVCGRTILKGERTEAFLAPGGRRHRVCELCFERAEHAGWIREAAAGDMPTRVERPEPRRGFLSRLRGRRSEPAAEPVAPDEPASEAAGPLTGGDGAQPEPEPPAEPARKQQERTRPKDPRHVRAVPTTAEVKVERALDLFNGSEHQRTVAGLARTLGVPAISAAPDGDQPSAVNVVVAWELSWYRYRVELGDEEDPVALVEKGEELGQIPEPMRDWNAGMDDAGNIVDSQAVREGAER